MLSFHPLFRHTATGPREIAKFRGWIKGGIQLAPPVPTCVIPSTRHTAAGRYPVLRVLRKTCVIRHLLRKFAFANWIPASAGMTTP